MSAIVSDGRTLNAMEKAGFITRDGRGFERHWTGASVRVITCHAGPKLSVWYEVFTYKGKEYRLEYFDGCFKPFVVRVGEPKPSFV